MQCPDCSSPLVKTKDKDIYKCVNCNEIFGVSYLNDNRSGDFLDSIDEAFEDRCLS